MNDIFFDSSGVLVLLGIGVFGGILTAVVFKRIKIPQVLGYMATGIVLGSSGLQIIKPSDIVKLGPVNLFCLAFIGFLVGGEIKFETMKKYGKQFIAILLAEGLTSFILVTSAVGLILYLITHNIAIAVSAGVVFGAIASATDPASTIAVLWEYRSAGILTLTLTAIVALDDALAMTLYGLGSGFAELLSQGSANFGAEIIHIGIEIFGSLALGIVVGLVISLLLRRSSSLDVVTASTVGLVMVTTGLADHFSMDIILASMAAGITVANFYPERYENLSKRIKAFSPIIYVLFFVFVGARLKIQSMPMWLWLIIGAYVVARSIGKIGGTWLGARISHANKIVSRVGGVGLLAQGGVAVGLSIMAAQKLEGIEIASGLALGDVIIFGITTTTFIVQIIGPAMVKVAVKQAKEDNRNIVAEDIAAALRVSDVPLITDTKVDASMPVREVLSLFSDAKADIIPVLDDNNNIVGIIGLNELRDLIFEDVTWDWLLAQDIVSKPKALIHPDQTLKDTLSEMEQLDIPNLLVVDKENKFEGIASRPIIKETIRNELVQKEMQNFK